MKYKIHILSQEYFEQIMQRRNITDSNVEMFKEETGKTYYPLTDEQAREIVDFVEKNQAKTYLIHCHAGISRSAGVGKFIRDHYDWVDTEWFDRDTNDRCYPNATVYGKLKEQFLKGG